jgi:hypothetical protein
VRKDPATFAPLAFLSFVALIIVTRKAPDFERARGNLAGGEKGRKLDVPFLAKFCGFALCICGPAALGGLS